MIAAGATSAPVEEDAVAAFPNNTGTTGADGAIGVGGDREVCAMHLLGDDPFGAVGGHRAELVRGLDNLWVTLPTWHMDDPRARAGAVQWTARDDEKGLANGLRRGGNRGDCETHCSQGVGQ